MTLPVFFPSPIYVPALETRASAVDLEELCNLAEVDCQGLGRWTKRPVVIRSGETLLVRSEPRDYGAVEVTLPAAIAGKREQARWALGAMAYSVFDQVARASIAGKAWARAALPPGRRPGGARPKTASERQRAFRQARADAILARDAALPTHDPRPESEIIEYDAIGLPQ